MSVQWGKNATAFLDICQQCWPVKQTPLSDVQCHQQENKLQDAKRQVAAILKSGLLISPRNQSLHAPVQIVDWLHLLHHPQLNHMSVCVLQQLITVVTVIIITGVRGNFPDYSTGFPILCCTRGLQNMTERYILLTQTTTNLHKTIFFKWITYKIQQKYIDLHPKQSQEKLKQLHDLSQKYTVISTSLDTR